MKRREALGAIGAILAAAVAPPFIPKGQLMPLKLIREATTAEIQEYAINPNSTVKATYAPRYYNGWDFAFEKDGRRYYKPSHPTLKAQGDLGVAPTPAEMDMLGMDPNFARPVFVPEAKQIVDHTNPEDIVEWVNHKTMTKKKAIKIYPEHADLIKRL